MVLVARLNRVPHRRQAQIKAYWNVTLRLLLRPAVSSLLVRRTTCIESDKKKQVNLLSNVYESKDRVCAADKDGQGVCAKSRRHVESESNAALPNRFGRRSRHVADCLHHRSCSKTAAPETPKAWMHKVVPKISKTHVCM